MICSFALLDKILKTTLRAVRRAHRKQIRMHQITKIHVQLMLLTPLKVCILGNAYHVWYFKGSELLNYDRWAHIKNCVSNKEHPFCNWNLNLTLLHVFIRVFSILTHTKWFMKTYAKVIWIISVKRDMTIGDSNWLTHLTRCLM